jgi:hypothetical protein
LTLGRAARVFQAVNEFRSLTVKYDTTGVFDPLLIEGFIKSTRVGDINEEDVKRDSYYCWSHGDLHGRNILVSQTNTGFLIDPANIEQQHWAADIARLIVDLIVSGAGHGDASNEWNDMAEWVDVSLSVINGDPVQKSGAPYNAVLTALDWLRSRLGTIHSAVVANIEHEWEFKLALAVEFMRAAYRQQDLPTPKRVLGLISACGALREACSSVRPTL